MIRIANKDDANYIIDLIKSYSDNTHIDKEYITNDMDTSYSKYLIYELENKIVGVINYHKFDGYGEIIDIIVNEKYRRKHIATELMKQVLNELNNCDITLEVKEKNEVAIKLYEKFKFKKVSTRNNYYKGQNAYLMKRSR